MLAMAIWLHEALALSGVLAAATWLVLRVAQVGRPREAGCSRCEHAPAGAIAAPATLGSRGVRSKRLRVLP
ncbi:hypothetical protein ACNOYE_17930 [Nannocystaceae bacterium ST9]